MLSKITQTFHSILIRRANENTVRNHMEMFYLPLFILTMEERVLYLLYLKCIDQWIHWPWAVFVTIPRLCTWIPPPQEQSDSQQQTSGILCFAGREKMHELHITLILEQNSQKMSCVHFGMSTIRAESQMSGAVCQMSGAVCQMSEWIVSSEGEDSEGYS